MLSSLDMTKLKHARLWVFLVVFVLVLAIVISFFRPAKPPIQKRKDHSLIEVKYEDDSMEKCTMASELQLKALLSEQALSKKIVEKQSLLINGLQKKEREQFTHLAQLENKMLRIKMQQRVSNRYGETVPVKLQSEPLNSLNLAPVLASAPIPRSMEISYSFDGKKVLPIMPFCLIFIVIK